MELVAVDIGNSLVKLRCRDEAAARGHEASELRLETRQLVDGTWSARQLDLWLRSVPEPARWLVAAVHDAAEQALWRAMRDLRPADTWWRLSRADVPLATDVQHPDRVGIDRLLDAWAANHLRLAHRPAIVIDAGSAVTVDAVSADGRFLGGAILPGLRMASAALSTGTALLPLVGTSHDELPEVIGRSTQQAIRSGVLWGTVGAVRELAHRMAEQLGADAHWFVTGGDARCLAPLAEPHVEFHPNLVLEGIRLLGGRLLSETAPP